MAKRTLIAAVAQLTKNGAAKYPWVSMARVEVTFTSSFDTCYVEGKTLKKIKGGANGGNYQGVEDGEIYRVWQHRA